MGWVRFCKGCLLVLSGIVVLIQFFVWTTLAEMTTKRWLEDRSKNSIAETGIANDRRVLWDVPPYQYDPRDKRDPFLPPGFSQPDSGSVLKRSGIEKSLKEGVSLVGIMSGTVGPLALLRFKDGEEMIVGPGSPISRIRGRVETITDQAVLVEIHAEQEDQKRSEKKTILRLNLVQSEETP